MNKTLCVKTLLTLCFAVLLFVGPSFAQLDAAVAFNWFLDDVDPNQGTGTLFAVVGGVLFEGVMPTPFILQEDTLLTSAQSSDPNGPDEVMVFTGPNSEGVVGFANGPGTSPNPGAPGGFYMGWGGQTVNLTGSKDGVTHTFPVQLVWGNNNDNRNRFDVNWVAFDTPDPNSNYDVNNGGNRFAFWVGDHLDGNRQSQGSQNWLPGQDFHTVSDPDDTDGNANFDDIGATFGFRNINGFSFPGPPTSKEALGGSVFFANIQFNGAFVQSDLSGISPELPGSFFPVAPFKVNIDVGPQGQRVSSDPNTVQFPADSRAPVVEDLPEGRADRAVRRRTVSGEPIQLPSGLTFAMSLDSRGVLGNRVGSVFYADSGDTDSPTELELMAEDQATGRGGIVRITLDFLPAGAYTITTIHRDATRDESNEIKIFLDTGLGFNQQFSDPNGTVPILGNADWDDAFKVFVDPNTPVVGGGGRDPDTREPIIDPNCTIEIPGVCNLIAPGVSGLNNARITETQSVFSFETIGLKPTIIIYDARFSTDGDNNIPISGLIIEYAPAPFPIGDVNQSGLVDEADLAIIMANMFEGAIDPAADINGDLVVDEQDYRLWKLFKGAVSPLAAASTASVPEPASLGIALLGAVALLGIRRRRIYSSLGAPLSEVARLGIGRRRI